MSQRLLCSNVALYASDSSIMAVLKLLWIVHRVRKDQCCRFDWRPRRLCLLSKEQEADLTRRLKEYFKRSGGRQASGGGEPQLRLLNGPM